MAIQFTDFSRAPLIDSPWKDALENVLKGYKMGQEPARMKQEAQKNAIANEAKRLEVEHKPKEYELNDKQMELVNSLKSKANEHYEERFKMAKDLNEANIQKANRPAGVQGAFAQALKFRDNLDPNSPTYTSDKELADKYLAKLSTAPGASAQLPGEGTEVNLPDGKKGIIQQEAKLPSGWQAITDPEGKKIGYNVPMDKDMVNQWKAKEKFDVIQPFLLKSLSEYSGQDSWLNFTDDVSKYNSDKAAKERIDNFFAAQDLMKVGATTENARIGGHNTNVQLKELKSTLDSSEVYHRLKSGSSFALPKGYKSNSGRIFKDYLDKIEKASKTNIPSHEFRALNPQVNQANQQVSSQIQNSSPEILGTQNGITTIKHGNKTLKIPQNLVDKYMMENSSSEFGGQYG